MTAAGSTVFVVDDDESVRRGLKRLLGILGYRVESFGTAAELLSRASFGRSCCIVLDIRMPGMTGLELQDRLAEQGDSPPIIFLTAFGDVPGSVLAMKRGAVDYLQKPVDERELTAAIQAALRRDEQRRREARERDDARAKAATLTPREREVMQYVVGGAANKQIAGWMGIAEKTVKIHRGRVMSKMCVGSVADLVVACQHADIAPRKQP